jgi:folate-binding Fe-S cluster repair protein YgfZ
VGQEVIIRVLHRGHGRVAKKLVRLDVDGVVAAGALLRSGDREVGRVTSVASLRGRSVALAYVHRDFAQGDTQLSLESGTLALVATGPVLRRSDVRASGAPH